MLNDVKMIVVDDSAFMRKMLADMVESNGNIEVIAKFKNGQELIDNIEKYDPDIITLDIEMPVLDGVETLKKLKYHKHNYSVIVLSSQSSKDSIKTLECLENGAIDFIQKPGKIVTDIDKIKGELICKIEAAVASKRKKHINKTTSQRKIIVNNNENSAARKSKIEAVVIGASTGGPKALQRVLPKISPNINVPVFVVQHMPAGFTKTFADRMDKMCQLKVVEANSNMQINSNTIYIAPGGHHMKIENKDTISICDEPPIWGVRPAVDKLFSSACNTYNGMLVSAVLTGMGRDGAEGTIHVKNAGGVTIAQDEATSTIYGMPKVAYETGKVDMVLSIDDIGKKISSIVMER